MNRTGHTPPAVPKGLHPRNPHRFGYDFGELAAACPELSPFVVRNAHGNESIDFANPDAVKMLNRALLKEVYGIARWDIPPGYLCPPVPGRADYIHYAADLLASVRGGRIPHGPAVRVLDIGIGANAIYPLIGNRAYGWRFTGSDIDTSAVASAREIMAANGLSDEIVCRVQASPSQIFKGIIQPGETYDLSICNPPFHASPEAAAEGTRRKWKNLGGAAPAGRLNFGGRNNELWCAGGETGFITRMVEESAEAGRACAWFTTLVSKKSNLPAVYKTLKKCGAVAVRTIDMAQGQKNSRIVAWTFRPKNTRKAG